MTDEIKAVAYYRMSSDKQEASIDDQRTAVEAFATSNGYKIVREYLDEGISGWKSEQRHGFQRLIADLESGDFQAVLCWDQDRFSRFPMLEASHYWYLLDRAGVHISTVAQGRLNFAEIGDYLKATVTQHGKSEFLRDLARNTARGLRKLKLEGRWVGTAPIGYRLESGRLQLGGGSEIETVQRIFGMRARGYGYFAIAKALNNDRCPTPRAESWHAASIRRILNNPVYIGRTVLGRRARGKYARVLDEVTIFEDTHPALVDSKTWAAVEKMQETKRRAHGRFGGDGAALAGLLRCGRCGNTMHAASGTKYVCSTNRTSGKCGYCAVDRHKLLKAIAAKIRQHILMGSVERLEAAIQRQLDRRRQAVATDLSSVHKLAALDRQIEKAGDRLLVVDDSLVAELEQRLLAMKRQRDALAATITQPMPQRALPSAKVIAAGLWELDAVLATAPATTVRHALAQLIEHVRLDFVPVETNYIGQSYRFTGGTICLRTQRSQPAWRATQMD